MLELIISIYDLGYNFSVMKEGKVLDKKSDEVIDIKEIYDRFNPYFEEILTDMYPNYRIIICEDGEVEELYSYRRK